MREFWLFLHIGAVVVWVGGMAFAHFCMRPSALALPPPQRLPLMAGALGRFFAQVLGALALLWASGLALMASAGFASSPPSWHAMMGIALVMTVIFLVIRFLRWPRLRDAVARGDWAGGAAALDGIRRLVVVNLALGVLTIAVATLGRLA
jgi:uncharacterized membrane protein